jgi:hypothetical protein
MTLKNYILLMIFATAACYLALLAVVFYFDPLNGGMALFFFYISLFLSLLGTFSLLGLFFRLFFTKDHLIFKKVTTSFRQAIWFSLLIIISLYLNHINLLAWSNLALLIIALTLLELFFISFKTKPNLKI